jgi:DNA adenine methylase
MIRPPFNRQGNKYLLLHEIIPLLPKHDLYVEPFVGSGAVFFNKEKTKSVLNDIDKEVVNRLKLLQNASLDISLYSNLDTLEKIKEFYIMPPKNIADKILLAKIKSSCGFNGKPIYNKKIYVKKNPYCITKHLNYYKEKLEDVIITNMDYFEIIKKYDDGNTLIYLDPPYENTKPLFYSECDFDYDLFAERLKIMKSKWILSINDSDEIRELFEIFFIKYVSVKSSWRVEPRKELIVANFPI